MKVREIMTKDIKIIPSDTTAKEAAEFMKLLDTGVLPIMEEDKIVGMITDRDIVLRVVAEGHEPSDTMVKFVMTRDVVSCHEDDDIQEAAKLMAMHQIRRLLVLDANRKVSGIVSLGNLAAHTDTKILSGDVLKEVSWSVKS